VNKACGAFITTMELWRHIYAAQLFQAFAAVLNFFLWRFDRVDVLF
jgi:hypothetical protein